MIIARAYAVNGPTAKFEPYHFQRRELRAHDILIEILYCGICHSDIHQARNEWNNAHYPMVPGHEIVGRVAQVGPAVTKFKEGEIAGVGCMVDSCRACSSCHEGLEQYCEQQTTFTYNSFEQGQQTITYGGYSSHIVVDENYSLKVSDKLPLANVAPLLCAGITTYSPLKRFNVGPNTQVGIVGLGGLGHMGVKIAAGMGANVTVLSTSPAKEQDAYRLGAHNFVVTKDPKNLAMYAMKFDFILDTVAAQHDLTTYANLLKRDATIVLVGAPENPVEINAFSLIMRRRNIAGSNIGGIKETQEMLDFCAAKNITSDVEVISINQIEEAYERTIKADVRYRFVIDMSTLK